MARATIEDVADAAGVSVATVDRVLNGRAAVRPKTVERVEKAIRLLNYQSDRLAARLARAKEYRFCFVLPEGNNAYMTLLADAVREEALRMAQEKVVIDLRHTDVFSAEVLGQTFDQIGELYDGVAVVALDHPRVREAINALCERGVAVVTLVSDVPGSRRTHYVGIDNAAAGRTAATLMGRYLAGRSGKVGLIAGSLSLRDHVERQFGFEQVMLHEYSAPHPAAGARRPRRLADRRGRRGPAAARTSRPHRPLQRGRGNARHRRRAGSRRAPADKSSTSPMN